MTWWLIPVVATSTAWAWTRLAGVRSHRVRPRPEPGSPQDLAQLSRFADALARPMPGDPR